jgi:hypothetical protein
MARDDVAVAQGKTVPRKLLSVVYLCLSALTPIAVVISIAQHHWVALFVSLVASVMQVTVAIAITRQSGPAMKLVGPIILAIALGYAMIAFAIG